jgi:hypothetical protein
MQTETFNIRHIEGQFLLRYSNAKVVMELGGDALDPIVATNANDQIVMTRRDLRSYSPMILRDQRLCFGDPSNWQKKTVPIVCPKCKDAIFKDIESFDMINPEKKIAVKFTKDAIQGIFWILRNTMHYKSPHVATNAEIDEIVLPLAKKFGWLSELERAVKLDRSKAQMLTREKLEPEMEESSEKPEVK